MKIQLMPVPLALIMLFTCAIVQATPNKESQSVGVIFENVRIFNGTASELSAPSNVLVVGNVIKSVSTEAITDPDGMKVTRIQGGGRTLMPGLIDNHVHLFMTGSSEMVMLNPKTSVETLNATTADEAEKMLLRGFTAVRDALMDATGMETQWPTADVIVGNPPFLGGSKKRGELGCLF